LKKPIYGLKQLPHVWFNKIVPALHKFGFVPCQIDNGIFVRVGPDGKKTYIVLYVDDLLIMTSDDQELTLIKRSLSEKFEMKDLSETKRFLGIQIEHGIFDGKSRKLTMLPNEISSTSSSMFSSLSSVSVSTSFYTSSIGVTSSSVVPINP
jgi:hypothetical protein